MGRRPIGRKYPKHISIQVKAEHNDDFKLFTKKLNVIGDLLTGKKWTIRDVMLTLFYSHVQNSPSWFVKNHFEGLTQDQLEIIRNKFIRFDNKFPEEPSPVKIKKKETNIKIKTKSKNPSLSLKLNRDYSSYLEKMNALQEFDFNE